MNGHHFLSPFPAFFIAGRHVQLPLDFPILTHDNNTCRFSKSDKGMFDLVYLYSESGDLQSAHIEHLPVGWKVRLPTDEYPVVFVTTAKETVYTFNIELPFEGMYWGE